MHPQTQQDTWLLWLELESASLTHGLTRSYRVRWFLTYKKTKPSLPHERQSVGHGVRNDIRIDHHDDSYDRTQRDRVPEHKPENNSFVPHLLGCSRGNRDRLCIHHLAHHATGAVC